MKPIGYNSFFLAALVLSFGISFVGYHYLVLANAYREANFVHLNAVGLSIDQIRQDPVPDVSGIERLASNVELANAQAIWCIETLGPIDLLVFRWSGGTDALGLCVDSTSSGDTILAELDRMEEALRGGVEAQDLSGLILDELEIMRSQSVAFQPQVTLIQGRLERLVRLGTGVVSLLLVLMSLLVGRQLSRAQRKIATQLLSDPLTGLLNRRGIDQVMEKSEETHGAGAVLIRIDLDRFKQVNDILGHEAGDVVLRHVADLMRRHSRSGDALARVGGDEFVIFCAAGTELEQAEALTNEILEDVIQPLEIDGKSCVFGASFGIATSMLAGLDTMGLPNAADKALYAVKRTGRGAVAVYSDAMHVAAERDRNLADLLPNALSNGEIVPYFQTQHFADDWKLFGIEVLARWNHPSEGVLTPDQFLGIARQMGLEAEIDRAIFRKTVELVDAMREDGLDVPRVAFNVGAARITDSTFLDDIRRMIPTDRERFAFEILESVSYEDASELLSVTIDAIKDLGFRVDVDDFGSGHASINSLLAVGPDALKIDRNIINQMVESPEALRMTVSIADLGRALGLHLIAEGVDTLEKATLLKQMGCHVLQGYLFSCPMPGAELSAVLRDGKAGAGREAS